MKRMVCILIVLALSLLLCACGEYTPPQYDPDSLAQLGSRVGETVYKLAIENQTGFSITALTVKCEQTHEFTGNVIAKDDPFENGDLKMLNFVAASPVMAPEEYLMSFVLGRDLFRTLHSVPFSETFVCTLYSDGDYCYLEYQNAAGETVSTKALEKAYYEEEKAKQSAEGCIGNEGLVY